MFEVFSGDLASTFQPQIVGTQRVFNLVSLFVLHAPFWLTLYGLCPMAGLSVYLGAMLQLHLPYKSSQGPTRRSTGSFPRHRIIPGGIT